MHRYRIVAQISLILFILNLVLAAPTVEQEIHGAHDDEMVVAEASQDSVAGASQDGVVEASQDSVAEAPQGGVVEAPQGGVVEASHDGEAEASQNGEAEASQHATTSPQHSLDGSVSSGYSIPYLSSDSDVSGYSWMLERPPRLSPERPSSLHDSDSTSLHPNSGSMDITPEEWLHGWLPAPLQEPTPGPYPSISGSAETPPPLQHTGSDRGTTEPEGLAPSQHLTSDEPPRSPPQPTETPPEGLEALEPSHHLTPDELFDNNMMERLKIVAGVAIVGGAIASIVGFQVKQHKHRDFQYS